jgi:2-keto-3-deoxy-L-rhamnonate aldolase RhmA
MIPPSQVKMAAYRPVCFDQPPDFRAALKEGKQSCVPFAAERLICSLLIGKTLVGSCMTILSSDIARFTSNIGFDFLFLDLEHSPMSPDTARDLIRTVHAQ